MMSFGVVLLDIGSTVLGCQWSLQTHVHLGKCAWILYWWLPVYIILNVWVSHYLSVGFLGRVLWFSLLVSIILLQFLGDFLNLSVFLFSPPWGFHSCIQFRFTKLDIFPLYIPFVFVWDFSDFIKTLITVFFQSSIVFNTIFFSACGYIGGFMQPLR